MRKELTEVVLIIDRSGSMWSCKTDVDGGVNQLIDDQRKQDGACNLTLAQFDTQHEVVYDGEDINKVDGFTLQPRGGTALLDAIGKTINSVGQRLSKTDEKDRPGLVSVVIVTDGYENASTEFTKNSIKEMIKHQEEKYGWKFSFLGADQDAFAEASQFGILNAATYSKRDSVKAFFAISSQHARMRSASLLGKRVDASYTSAELKSMKGEG